MGKILKHHYPNRSLDLAGLRALSKELFPDHCDDQELNEETEPCIIDADKEQVQKHSPSPRPTQPPAKQKGLVLEEIGPLHEELGCLMRDSKDEWRYIGAEGGISFNAAVRYLAPNALASKEDKDVIPGMKTTVMPPTSAEGQSRDRIRPNEIYLPQRGHCSQYVDTYLEEVHSSYWLYSREDLQAKVDRIYMAHDPVSSSWLCSLYSIFALGSQNPGTASNLDARTSSEYLLMAKSLIPRVCDEAGLESVRALILVVSLPCWEGMKALTPYRLLHCNHIASQIRRTYI
jgi:hypothetical protein